MNFFNNLKVSLKLGALILVAFLLLVIVGGSGYYYLQKTNLMLNVMYRERLVPNNQITRAFAEVNADNSYVLELMLSNDEQNSQLLITLLNDSAKKIDQSLAAVENLPLDTKAKDMLIKIKDSQQQCRAVSKTVIDLVAQNKKAEAYALYSSKFKPLFIAYIASTDELSNYYSELGEKMNADSQAAASKASHLTIGIIIVAFILLGLIGATIAKAIIKPLGIMVAACKELAAGDFRDKPSQVVSKDEVGQVADAIDRMRSSLRTVLRRVNESAEQVAASSEELTASAEQSAQAVTQVAGSINGVAQGAEKQLNAVNETSAVVEQMSAGIQQVAVSSNQVAEHSAQAADKAKEGNAVVEKAVIQMANIEQTVNNSAQVVAKLGERSKEIGQIVNTISSIAGQTNLLALNAAIEAARAGEQGRGFAVVAEEVRKLAEQSQKAAKQIATLIGEIQGDTDKAVVAMGEGTREVEVGTAVVTTAGKAFQEIAAIVTNMSGELKEISIAMQQMASGSQQIVASVKEIDGHSKTAVGQAQTVSAATEEQAASMEQIASSSQSLAKLSQDLQVAVEHFKV